MRQYMTWAPVLVSVVVMACGPDAKPPATAPAGQTQAPTSSAAPASAGGDKDKTDVPSRSQINISEEIRRACGITDTDAFFAFDSAQIRPQDHKILGQLADCFLKGPLKGRIMRLVGHADPRGDDEYNMVLGGRRADSVRQFIVQKGLPENRMQTTSRGKMDATGTDEAGWSRDRRVDVVLAQ
jgi:peptidoglycan-associated lipoprotein